MHEKAIMMCMSQLPKPYRVAVGGAIKSRDQEEKYHAIIGEIATQAKHVGSSWDAESWKRLLIDDFVREWNAVCEEKDRLPTGRLTTNLRGDGVVQLAVLSRDFTKKQASGFVEYLHAWCAQNGVELSQ
jgi:hypothetical protein